MMWTGAPDKTSTIRTGSCVSWFQWRRTENNTGCEKPNLSGRKVLEAAAKDFKVPLRRAKFSIKHPDFQLNIPVRSNSYIGDFRESLGLFQHGQNSVKLKLKRSDQSNEVHDDDYVI